MYGVRRERQRWYVVFQPGKPGFWSPFLSRRWGHCWAFRAWWLEGQPGLLNTCASLKVEVLRSMIDVDFWPTAPDEVAEHYLADPRVTDIVALDVDVDGRLGYIPRGLLTCVSGVKAALQLRAWWILTPRQLHHLMLLRGGSSLRSEAFERHHQHLRREAEAGHVAARPDPQGE